MMLDSRSLIPLLTFLAHLISVTSVLPRIVDTYISNAVHHAAYALIRPPLDDGADAERRMRLDYVELS
jgi:hypothetical protein